MSEAKTSDIHIYGTISWNLWITNQTKELSHYQQYTPNICNNRVGNIIEMLTMILNYPHGNALHGRTLEETIQRAFWLKYKVHDQWGKPLSLGPKGTVKSRKCHHLIDNVIIVVSTNKKNSNFPELIKQGQGLMSSKMQEAIPRTSYTMIIIYKSYETPKHHQTSWSCN